jgi:hypothetical protein
MADTSIAGEIVTRQEAQQTGLTDVAIWLKEIERAKKDEDGWRLHACEAIRIYEGGDDKDKSGTAFNILHSNIETVVPALYNSTPVPDVRRRYSDADQMAKQAVDVIERAVSYSLDQHDFDGAMLEATRDRSLAGRGVVRVRYKPHMQQQMDPMTGQPFDAVGYQETYTEYVTWDRFVRGPATVWERVPWIAYEHDLTESGLRQIGVEPERIQSLTFDDSKTSGGSKEGEADKKASTGVFKTVKVYEIWDKDTRSVLFVSPQDKDQPLAVKEDPLGLPGFFDTPKPLQGLRKRRDLTPLCPYEIYRPLITELETVQRRINALVSQLKVRGLVDGQLAIDLETVRNLEDGQYKPVEDASKFLGGGGKLENAVAHWPMDPIVMALRELYVQREATKQTIFEVSGLSDILRGQSNASETATAQQIKQQWGSMRIQVQQADVARYARDLFRLMASIICQHFTPENLSAMTQIKIAPEVAQLLKDDVGRGFRIDIESDSTIRADMSRTQEQMGKFLEGTGMYMQSMGGLFQAMPEALPAMIEIYTAFARKFKLGKQAEDALEKLPQIMQQKMQAMEQAKQQPSPEQQKAEADAKAREAEMGMKREGHQLDMQAKAADVQTKQQLSAMKLREAEQKAVLAQMAPAGGQQ